MGRGMVYCMRRSLSVLCTSTILLTAINGVAAAETTTTTNSSKLVK